MGENTKEIYNYKGKYYGDFGNKWRNYLFSS